MSDSTRVPFVADTDELIKELAARVHHFLCNQNHTEGCGWYYTPDNWTEHSHEKYHQIAVQLLASGVNVVNFIDGLIIVYPSKGDINVRR